MDNKILVAEDEEKIRRLVSSYLVREGFKVVEAADGQQAVEKFEDNEDVVLVMLDVMMPKKDGYDACREIRGKSNVPILMLTARDSEQDEVAGFGAGADEYIAKPFSPTILVTRVKNLLRRTSSNDMSDVSAGGVKVLYRERTVTVDGKKIITTPKEFDLLYYFVVNPGRVINKMSLAESVWGDNIDQADSLDFIYSQVKNLRKKLKQAEATIELKAVYGFGYKLSER